MEFWWQGIYLYALCLQAVTAKFEAAVEKMKEANESIAASRRELTTLTERHRDVADRLVKLGESIEEKKAHYNEVNNQVTFVLI